MSEVTGKYHVHPEDPPPADSFTDESTDDGPQDGSAIRRSSEESDREATLIVIPDVRNGTAR